MLDRPGNCHGGWCVHGTIGHDLQVNSNIKECKVTLVRKSFTITQQHFWTLLVICCYLFEAPTSTHSLFFFYCLHNTSSNHGTIFSYCPITTLMGLIVVKCHEDAKCRYRTQRASLPDLNGAIAMFLYGLRVVGL